MYQSTSVVDRQGPATPNYVLRGHCCPVHSLDLFDKNLRLVSGDSDGWVVVWNLVIKRPVGVWKAHASAILEVKGLRPTSRNTEIYTHGRDHKLRVWRFSVQDEPFLEKKLPVDVATNLESGNRIQPWLIHSVSVNALNFCSFAMLRLGDDCRAPDGESDPHSGCSTYEGTSNGSSEQSTQCAPEQRSITTPVLIAVANALNSGAIDLFHLPLEKRICTIPADSTIVTGMVMAIKLFGNLRGDLYICSAYEDGHVMVFVHRRFFTSQDWESMVNRVWEGERVYANRAHSQPVLSIDLSPERDYFLSSSADAVLVKHPIIAWTNLSSQDRQDLALKTLNTRHAGQQGLRVRSDGRIFATAGWDSRIRVYSCKTMKELAVLKWHKEGCYAVAFADVLSVPSFEHSDSTDIEPEMQNDGINQVQQLAARASEYTLATIQRQRNGKVQTTHWLASGSKDGRISLWDIY